MLEQSFLQLMILSFLEENQLQGLYVKVIETEIFKIHFLYHFIASFVLIYLTFSSDNYHV